MTCASLPVDDKCELRLRIGTFFSSSRRDVEARSQHDRKDEACWSVTTHIGRARDCVRTLLTLAARSAHLALCSASLGACVCPGCHASQLRTLVTLTAAHARAGSVAAVAVASSSRSAATAAAAPRLLHTSAPRRAAKPPPPPEDDLEDLFGEELDMDATAAGASKSSAAAAAAPSASSSSSGAAGASLSSLLASTRAATSSSRSASAPSLDSAAAPGLVLLDPSNPPRLEGRHFALLKSAAKDMGRKLEQARVEAKEAIMAEGQLDERQAEEAAENAPKVKVLLETESRLASLCRRLFPPENPAGFDDKRVGELLDYAESMPGVMHLVQPDTVDPMKLMAFDQKTTRQNRHQFCLFCKPSTAILERNTLVYTNVNLLTQFLNQRGMIIQRDESRLCMKHQRAVARTIKRARAIGLLSPMSNWRVPADFVYGTSGSKFSAKQAAEVAAGGQGRNPYAKQADLKGELEMQLGGRGGAAGGAAAGGAAASSAASNFDLGAFDELSSFGQESRGAASGAGSAGASSSAQQFEDDEDDFTGASRPNKTR